MKEQEVICGISTIITNSDGTKQYTFYGRTDGYFGTQTRVVLNDKTYSFNIHSGLVTNKSKEIPNLVFLSEEEFFQLSLVWEHDTSIDLVRAVQKYGLEVLSTPDSEEFKYLADPLELSLHKKFQY